MSRSACRVLCLALTALLFTASARAQFARNVVVPQSRSIATGGGATSIAIVDVGADVDVMQRVAVTSLTIHLRNLAATVEEAEILMPIPDGATIRSFDFLGKSSEPTAKVLPVDEARRTYESLVSKIKDPAILEFAGRAMVRSSVFPVPGKGTQTVRLVYEHLLEGDGDRIDYELPRSESLAACAIPWRVEVRLRASKPIASAYSPTHSFQQIRVAENELRLRLMLDAAREPGPIDFSYLLQGDGVNGSYFLYPDRGDDGYFLLLGGVPVKRDPKLEKSRKREVVVVLDTSGSMAGTKIEQAKAAALQVLEGLDEGERFNIIDYSDQVRSFESEPIAKTKDAVLRARGYIETMKALGGTNLHGALERALAQPHDEAMIPIVLFLTDGLPTIGVTDEATIRGDAETENKFRRRIFTFGVGDDVNAPLLDVIATRSRATSAYVRPNEAVEKRVSEVFVKLKDPILASPQIAILDTSGKPADARAVDLLPTPLPDLFDGDELVLTGRYRGKEPLVLEIRGDYLGTMRAFRFELNPAKASLECAYVPRLWASRRIGFLVDQLRQAGAVGKDAKIDEKANSEVANEVYRLSREFGVMTEYTAFLALEGTNLDAEKLNVGEMNRRIASRLQNVRTGRGAIVQAINTRGQAAQSQQNRRNRMLDSTFKNVEIQGVAQIGDRAFYKRGDRWIDSKLPRSADPITPAETVEFDSEAHRTLVGRLLMAGRQGVIALSLPPLRAAPPSRRKRRLRRRVSVRPSESHSTSTPSFFSASLIFFSFSGV